MGYLLESIVDIWGMTEIPTVKYVTVNKLYFWPPLLRNVINKAGDDSSSNASCAASTKSQRYFAKLLACLRKIDGINLVVKECVMQGCMSHLFSCLIQYGVDQTHACN